MIGMFRDATSFNGDISSWNVSSVTDMGYMFNGATSFNRDISSWDASSVTYMSYMFRGADNFNQTIGGWNVSSAAYMTGMFANATAFNQKPRRLVRHHRQRVHRQGGRPRDGRDHIRPERLPGRAENPTYAIEPGGDSHRFTIVEGNILNMVSVAADRTTYEVTIAATGDLVFEDGNNRRTIEVTLMG